MDHQGGLYLPWCVDPRQMCEVRVHRHTHHLTVDIMEFIGLVTERNYLCGTHEGAVIKQHRESQSQSAKDTDRQFHGHDT